MAQVFVTVQKLLEVIQNIQKCLQCTICLNTVSDPMITPCGHRFCRTCIQKVLQNQIVSCPLCNTTINRRNIYGDKRMAVYVDAVNNLIEAIKLDSGVDILDHLPRPHRVPNQTEHITETSLNTKQSRPDIQEQVQPSCSYKNTTIPLRDLPVVKTTQRKEQNSKKRNETKENSSIKKYLSTCGLSGVEPLALEKSNNVQEISKDETVQNWLKTLTSNEPLDSPNRNIALQPTAGNLDDTLSISISQNDFPVHINKMETFDADDPAIPKSTERSSVQDCGYTSRSSTNDENNENDSNRKKERRRTFVSTDNQKTITKEDKERSDVLRTSTCNTLKQNWSSVARFGKEMRTKRKKLKTLDVSIEKTRSPENPDESVGLKSTEGREKTRRRSEESRKSENEGKRKEFFLEKKESLAKELPAERGDRSTSEAQPLGESSFITLNEGQQVRIRNLNNLQTNEIIGIASEGSSVEKPMNGQNTLTVRRYVELFEASLEGRAQTPVPSVPNGFYFKESKNSHKILSSTPSKTIEKPNEPSSTSRPRSSPQNLSKLSLKRRATDSKADDSCAEAYTRLQTVRRDLNHRIDQSGEENADARKQSAVEIIGTRENGEEDERVKGLAAVSSGFTSKKQETRKQSTGSLVSFKKLGKVYKVYKKRVRFLYLGTTNRRTLLGHGHARRSLRKLHNPVDILEEDAFGSDLYISFNDTLTLREDKPQTKETCEKPTKLDQEDKPAQQKPPNLIVDKDIPKFGSADVLVVSLDEVPPTQPIIEQEFKSPEKKLPSVAILSPSEDSQLRFLSAESPTEAHVEPEVLQTKKHRSEPEKDDDRSKRSYFSETRGAHSRTLMRTSQQASSDSSVACCGEKRSINLLKLLDNVRRMSEESNSSEHSVSSQATCIRTSNKNEASCRSFTHSTKDIEAVSLNTDTDFVASGMRKIQRKPLLLTSSDESPEILCVNTVNEQQTVSPSVKRKRDISPDSENEMDLIKITSNWFPDTKSDERCKKRGKLSESQTSNSINVAKDNRASFPGNNWRQNVKEVSLFDEDSPDFGVTIDKIKDIRKKAIEQPDGNAKTVQNECLLQDNFDDIMANVDTEALIEEYNNDGRNKEDDQLSNSNSSQRSKKRKKTSLLNNSYDSNENTLVSEAANKISKIDNLQEIAGPFDIASSSENDRLVMNKSLVNEKYSYEQDSLMDVTQHDLMIKQFEKDLFEKSSNTLAKKFPGETELETPRRMKNARRSQCKDVEHSGEEDDIVENTPDTKTKSLTHAFNSPRESEISPISKIIEKHSMQAPPSTIGKKFFASGMSTPLCKRSIHPLYQSTPKAQQPISKNNNRSNVTNLISNLNESTSSRQAKSSSKENLSNVNKQRFCFVCSGLVSSQIEQVKSLAQMVNGRYLSQFEKDVTHVIVKTDKEYNGANKTLKYLQGVAYGKWIVSYQWVMDSLKERRLISEKPYEAVDCRTLEAGPRKSRLRESNLFEGFTFLCIGPYDDVTVQQYQDLLRATGGIVVDSLEALAAEKKRWKIIVIQADMYDYEMIIEWHKETQAVPIVHDWIVECISRYKVISFYPYLQELSRKNVLMLGYPEFLIEEEPDEDFDNTANSST